MVKNKTINLNNKGHGKCKQEDIEVGLKTKLKEVNT